MDEMLPQQEMQEQPQQQEMMSAVPLEGDMNAQFAQALDQSIMELPQEEQAMLAEYMSPELADLAKAIVTAVAGPEVGDMTFTYLQENANPDVGLLPLPRQEVAQILRGFAEPSVPSMEADTLPDVSQIENSL